MTNLFWTFAVVWIGILCALIRRSQALPRGGGATRVRGRPRSFHLKKTAALGRFQTLTRASRGRVVGPHVQVEVYPVLSSLRHQFNPESIICIEYSNIAYNIIENYIDKYIDNTTGMWND